MATILAGKAGQKNQPNINQSNSIADFFNRRAWMLALLVCWVVVMLTAALLFTMKLAQLDSVKHELESPLIANEASVSSDNRSFPKTRRLPGKTRKLSD